jgi:hypothetical protein
MGISLWAVGATQAPAASDLESQVKALAAIREFANDLCGTYKTEGSSSSLELSGDAQTKLGGTIARVLNLGIEGAAQYRSEVFKNLLQKDLATILQKSTDCKLDVFKLLQEKMILSVKEAPAQTAERILDRIKSDNPAQRSAAITDITASDNPDLLEIAIEQSIRSAHADMRCWAIRTKFARVQDFRVELTASDGTSKSIADAQTNNSSAYASVPNVSYDRKTGRFQSSRWRLYSGNVGCDGISFTTDSICMGTLRNKIGSWDFHGTVSCRYYQGSAPFNGTFVLN